MEKVSVTVPVYNIQTHLDECLNSLLNQTFKGIEMAQGEYIRFVNQNDRIDFDSFEKFYNAVKENGCDVAFALNAATDNSKHKRNIGMKSKNIFKALSSLINNFCFIRVKANYKAKLKQLNKEYLNRKLNVIFYVSENSKWCYQSLYEEFEKDEHFNPLVLVGILKDVHKGKDKFRNNLEENYNFFKSQNMNVEYAYQNRKYINFKKFKPDIVFYEQPWGLPKIYHPDYVSKFALTCYCCYGLMLFDNPEEYKEKFHKYLWRYFSDSEFNIERYSSYDKYAKENCISFGYPKMDVYFDEEKIDLNKYWKNPEKIKIIYAPHHSFEDDGLRLATFRENGKYILNLAKEHPETTWIFKPHPRFKCALFKNKIMTQEEIEQYYNDWNTVGRVYTKGAYFDIFKTSDFLITDCCSFLGEYLPTLKPIINLINPNASQMNIFGKLISKCCFKTKNNDEFYKTFTDILSNKDTKFEERKEAVKYVIDFDKKSSEKIVGYIKEKMENEETL